MKLLHCADLHLDSKMQTHLNSDKARERRIELLENFSRMVRFAAEHEIEGILISGDLFDVRRVSAQARNMVLGEIKKYQDIVFFYLRGNHDADDLLKGAPENLKLFDDSWKSYPMGNERIVISGVELRKENAEQIYANLHLNEADFNIVMLHGQLADYASGNRAEVIQLSSLRNKNIDYLALGHIHQYQEGTLFPRGEWAYPGCLEGRGMDEPGEHGFIILDINPETHSFCKQFYPFARRTVYEIPVDITGVTQMIDIRERVQQACKESGAASKDYVHVILQGEVDAEAEKELDDLLLTDEYYVVKIDDETRFSVDYKSYEKDASLKGELIRLVQGKEELSEEEKAEIIRMGILLLRGEDIEW